MPLSPPSADTEYTEDVASPADPVGGAIVGRVRTDFETVEVAADGDWVAIDASTKGELRVKDDDVLGVLTGIANNQNTIINDLMVPLSTEAVAVEDNHGVPLVARARTTPGTETGVVDGDAVILNATAKGELYVKQSDAIPAGTNNIGDVDVLSIAAGDNNIGNVDIVTQPARAATTDNIGAKLATDAIMNGVTALTPKFAIIDAASSGDNTLVASVSSKKIRVLALFMVSAGTVNVRFESGAAGTALTGQMNLIANSGFTLPFNPVGWFETAATTLLNLELSGAVSVDGALVYVEV